MPEQTPKARLIDRVESELLRQGLVRSSSRASAIFAVESFYAEDHEHPHYTLVAQQAVQIVIDAMPPFVTGMRAAFESMQRMMSSVQQAARAVAPYSEMVKHVKASEDTATAPRFDSSGIPINDHPDESRRVNLPSIDPNRGVPCIEEGCTSEVENGAARCYDCQTEEDRMENPGIFIVHPGRADGGPVPNFMFVPEDRITGRPHHYIVNGDHSECPCGGHATECTTWNVPGEAHPASICQISRTLCQHTPRHLYRQPCSDDPHTSPVSIDPMRARGDDGPGRR